MKKKLIIGFCALALIIINVSQSVESLQSSVLFEHLITVAFADTETGGGWNPTTYEGIECCETDNGCHSCTTTYFVHCWVPGPYPCTESTKSYTDIYC